MHTNATVATPQHTVVKIIPNEKGNPAGKLADVELHFVDGVFAGLKLIGFSIWERRTGAAAMSRSRRGSTRSMASAAASPSSGPSPTRPISTPSAI
jgi:hypothetical protein